jgi:hypothetical protein
MMGIDLDVLSKEELMEVLTKEMVLAITPSMKREKLWKHTHNHYNISP